MTRVSLREAYDNKDVVAQILSIRDTAESAVDTSEQAVTTANTASEHVDALVPQVEGAVENANSASASAQTSAQTVAGYENRLGTVETGLSTAQHDITAVEDNVEDLSGDLNAVTLRVTTAEGNIVTIQGRVTALETADGQNVKINRINDYAVGLTGEQLVNGPKINQSVYSWVVKSIVDENHIIPDTPIFYPLFAWFDKNNNPTCTLVLGHNNDGKLRLYARLLKWNPNTQQSDEVATNTIVVES